MRVSRPPGWLIARCLAGSPELTRELIHAAKAGGDGSDALLRARRLLEFRLGTGPGSDISDASYRKAAAALQAAGHPAAETVGAIAATGTELRAVAEEWRNRYANRPRSEAESRVLAQLSARRVVTAAAEEGMPGIDGAWYGRADLLTDTGSRPVVIMTTRAGLADIVDGFASEQARQAWLDDRAPGRTGPLASCGTGPPCRAVHEEQVLAWLLQNRGGSGEGWKPQAFTTYSRSEIFLAWLTAARVGPGADSAHVQAELERRLLRAPRWAAGDVGWPFGQDAVAYLHRLTVTPVATMMAQSAARQLLSQDKAARRSRPAQPAFPARPRVSGTVPVATGPDRRPQLRLPGPAGFPVPRA
jgi:hypothetical protein